MHDDHTHHLVARAGLALLGVKSNRDLLGNPVLNGADVGGDGDHVETLLETLLGALTVGTYTPSATGHKPRTTVLRSNEKVELTEEGGNLAGGLGGLEDLCNGVFVLLRAERHAELLAEVKGACRVSS